MNGRKKKVILDDFVMHEAGKTINLIEGSNHLKESWNEDLVRFSKH